MTGNAEEKDHTKINNEIVVDTDGGGPKSKKELRLERKAAKKKLEEKSKTTKEGETNDGEGFLDKEEYARLKKLRRKEEQKEQEKLMQKKLQEEKKLRKRKKLNRELNTKGGAKKKPKVAEDQNPSSSQEPAKDSAIQKNKDKSRDEQDVSMNAFRSVLYGTIGESSNSGGMITTRLGVQYKDKVVGTGKLLKEGKPITVKYELTGGKFGAVLDSSKKFTFRPGMGEVIQGWDIGLEGMREGGRRKLIIPPKAGYGGKDIGAGPGALLNFDVTLISCGR